MKIESDLVISIQPRVAIHNPLEPWRWAARKWRGIEEMKRKWRENKEMERE